MEIDLTCSNHQLEIQQILKDASNRISKFKEALESKQEQVKDFYHRFIGLQSFNYNDGVSLFPGESGGPTGETTEKARYRKATSAFGNHSGEDQNE
jgi:hypothetical protein